MLRDIGITCESADANTAAIRQLLDLGKRQPIDIDELRWPLDAHFHQVDQVRSAGEKLRARVRRRRTRRLLRISRACVSEWIHAPAAAFLPPTDLIASTMFGYAPQRQRLPLIHSRISSSLRACPSPMHATAEQI